MKVLSSLLVWTSLVFFLGYHYGKNNAVKEEIVLKKVHIDYRNDQFIFEFSNDITYRASLDLIESMRKDSINQVTTGNNSPNIIGNSVNINYD